MGYGFLCASRLTQTAGPSIYMREFLVGNRSVEFCINLQIRSTDMEWCSRTLDEIIPIEFRVEADSRDEECSLKRAHFSSRL